MPLNRSGVPADEIAAFAWYLASAHGPDALTRLAQAREGLPTQDRHGTARPI